jgi:hypothetical protein
LDHISEQTIGEQIAPHLKLIDQNGNPPIEEKADRLLIPTQ